MNLTTPLVLNANRHPDKMCVTCEGRTYSYQQFNEEVNKLANGLIQLGLKHGEKIGLFMKNSDHFVIALYAIWKAGGVVVPINFRLVAPEVAYILEQSECKMVFCDAGLEDITANADNGHNSLEHIIVQQEAKLHGHLSWASILSDDCSEPRMVVLNTDNAQILYTSGTTGRPKGALFDHQRVMNVNMNFLVMKSMAADDVFLHLAPLFHSAQLNGFFTTAIYLGASSVIHRDFDPVSTLEAIEEYGITVFFGVPAMYNAILQVQGKQYNLSSVRVCGYGAAPMAPALVERAVELFGTDQFYNLCGLTEAGPGGVFLAPEDHKTKLGAGGKAMFLTNVRVVTDDMENVKPGEVGEFVIKGETIMKEYYRRPEETQRAFSDGWLLTGDMATVDEDGFITIVDRKKDMIISGGENVYSVEVEQVLNSHPQILEAATIGLPDEKWGETVVGIIVSKENLTLNEEEVKNFCSERLAAYKIPKKFIYTEVLPRNASGKILKYQLREEIK
ncbi:long-chain fatty acid--CoA ligase [Viridibacillus sp. YIM B01967]|uniref:Long-chain fatty acid--CoA ligase n=1 Tax=Viridibacillus soli TaxID=2798301 RepID=A0ABS1H7R4_9BACL|nr:long-chain fatty acid--CoA ligase [Viridibacillus soli]MBK3495458.1 long-chain fatty acid--CoA ligase [Viridibacillus soli]